MKKIIIFTVIAVGFVTYWWSWHRNGETMVSGSPTVLPTAIMSPMTSTIASPTATAISDIKSFTVMGSPFSFSVSQMSVNKGDTVEIKFQNKSGTHDWRLDEFNAHTDVIRSGQEQTIQFVADKTGTFEYYCSVGTHRQMGMKGTLIVK